jgi:hypothetical protein
VLAEVATVTVHVLPGVSLQAAAASLNLSPDEVREAAGGYLRPADQLRELHARGFTRAYRSKVSGRVILERAHYEAVVRGQFGSAPAADGAPGARLPLPPNRAGYRSKFGTKSKGQ